LYLLSDFSSFFQICLRSLSIQTENPILQELNRGKTECKFKDLGCTWRFLPAEMDKHTKECKYRLCACIGKTLGVWPKCQWTGQQSQLKEHIERAHPICSNNFGYFQEGCVPFHPDAMTLNLVDAFNKLFVFFFNSRSDVETINFVIFVLGRKEDAAQYFYEFELKAPDQQYSKVTKYH
jgi:Seven in absentia protein family